MSHILDQGDTWVGRDKTEHRIAEMNGLHALRTYEMLKRQHKHLAREYVMGYLLRLSGPNGEMASEAFELAVEDEIRRATDEPFLWLLDKPLLKALARRIKQYRVDKGWENPNPEPQDPDYPDPRPTSTYQAPAFKVKPVPDLDERTYGPQPGDDRRIFIVTVGYDGETVKGVFVGNRLAAYQMANELDRYDPYAHSEVTEWIDQALPGSVDQVRTYRPAWSQVEYSTQVSLATGRVVVDCEPEVYTVTDRAPRFDHKREMTGARGDYHYQIITRGPDKSIDRVRNMHTHRVNSVIAQVLGDLKGENR